MRIVALVMLSFLIAAAARGQVIQTEHGPVEFIGLERRTPAEVMRRLSEAHGGKAPRPCAADLRELGYPDAAVQMFRAEDGGVRTVVTLVEPEHARRVRYRLPPTDQAPTPERWRALRTIIEEATPGVRLAIEHRGLLLADPSRPREEQIAAVKDRCGGELPCEPGEIEKVWDAIALLDAPEDMDAAVWAIRNDRDAADRILAACVLSSFADWSMAWWELADGLRDPDPMVRTFCQWNLATITRHVPREVDWSPAMETVRPLVDGTNLFAHRLVLDMLVKTQVSWELAGPLLGEGGDLVLALTRAEDPEARDLALAMLRHLNGEDLGTDPAAWEEWIGTLG